MLLIISTIVMLVFFVGLIVAERKAAMRDKAALGKLNDMVADLGMSAKARYQETFGREPTAEIPIYRGSATAKK